jgi:hypothetical protein
MPRKVLNPNDYIGNKYNMLTILGIFKEHKYPSHTRMLCRCDCGATSKVLLFMLTGGLTISCGCYAKKIASEAHLKDETGNTYGNITVIERCGSSSRDMAQWRCRCNICNKEFVTEGHILRSCGIKSCRECALKRIGIEKRKVAVGDKFEKLTVISIYDTDAPENFTEAYVCECICECGKTTIVPAHRLIAGNTKSCGCLFQSLEHRKKLSASHRNIPLEEWTGFSYESGVLGIRHSQEYKDWRKSVCKRDNWTCQRCGKNFKRDNNNLHAHHLNSFADFEDQRFDISNGVTLCSVCHAPRYVGSFHNLYGTQHNTREQFEEWLRIPTQSKYDIDNLNPFFEKTS